MLIGHNPGFTEFANLVDEVSLDNLPTAGMLCIEFDAPEWPAIEPAHARLAWRDYPKRHP
jgi:phosphohistidine phosphatase